MTTTQGESHRSRTARHVAIVPRGKGILERLFGFTPKPKNRRATFLKA